MHDAALRSDAERDDMALPARRRTGHPYSARSAFAVSRFVVNCLCCSAPPRHKKPRTSFGREQIGLLEARFHEQKYLASSERAALARALHMSDAQVKTW